MFEFKPVLDSIETCPVDFRGLYAEKDGKFVLRSEDAGVKSAVSAIQGLQGALTKSRAEVRTLGGKVIDLSPLGEYGTTIEEIQQGIGRKLEEATKGKKGPEEIQAAVQAAQRAMTEAHGKELKSRDDRLQLVTGSLNTHLVQSEARAALAELGAVSADLILPFLERQVRVVEENGKFSVQVLQADGNPRYSGTGAGPMTIKELVSEMRSQEQYKPFFKSDKPSGGGTPGAGGGGRPAGGNRENMSSREKIALGLAQRKG